MRILSLVFNFSKDTHLRQSIDALEIGVLDRHHIIIGEQLLRIVVDELSIYEHVDAVRADFAHFLRHLLLLGRFQLGHLDDCVDAHACAEDLQMSALLKSRTRSNQVRTFTLSVSIGVFAMRIRAFSMRCG